MTAASFSTAVSYAEEAVGPTRTLETEAKYRPRFQQLWAQFKRRHHDPAPTLLAYVEWLFARRAMVKATSFRQYQNASLLVTEDQMTRESG